MLDQLTVSPASLLFLFVITTRTRSRCYTSSSGKYSQTQPLAKGLRDCRKLPFTASTTTKNNVALIWVQTYLVSTFQYTPHHTHNLTNTSSTTTKIHSIFNNSQKPINHYTLFCSTTTKNNVALIWVQTSLGSPFQYTPHHTHNLTNTSSTTTKIHSIFNNLQKQINHCTLTGCLAIYSPEAC